MFAETWLHWDSLAPQGWISFGQGCLVFLNKVFSRSLRGPGVGVDQSKGFGCFFFFPAVAPKFCFWGCAWLGTRRARPQNLKKKKKKKVFSNISLRFFSFFLVIRNTWWLSGKESTRQCRRQVWSLGREDPRQEGLAARSSALAWRILWTEEPGGPQAMVSQSRTQLKQLSLRACNTFSVTYDFLEVIWIVPIIKENAGNANQRNVRSQRLWSSD